MTVVKQWGESFGSGVIGCAEAWGDGQLGLNDFSAPAFAGLDLLGAFLDPVNWIVGNLLEPLYNWIFENCKPLTQLIEAVTGSPDQVRAQAEQYQKVSRQIADQANAFLGAVNAVLTTWEGQTRDAFRRAAAAAVEMQRGVAQKQHELANAFYMLAGIVSAVKEIVVSLIKELVTDLVTKAVMAALAAIPSLGSAIAAYMTWAAAKYAFVMGKVARTFQKAATRASKFVGQANVVGRFFADMARKLGKLAAKYEAVVKLHDLNVSDRKNNIPLAQRNQEKWDEKYGQTGKDAHRRRRDRAVEDEVRAGERITQRNGEVGQASEKYGPGKPTAGAEGAEEGYGDGTKRDDRSNPADSIGTVVE